MPVPAMTEAEFWGSCIPEPNTGCWLWSGSAMRDGYGRVCQRGKTVLAHRWAWELTHGPIPAGLFICHRCDVRGCCNPAHLFLGTHADNMADRNRKGRHARGASFSRRIERWAAENPQAVAKGERHGMARITTEQVQAVRSAYGAGGVSQAELARRFGMTRQLISKIVLRTRWRHV